MMHVRLRLINLPKDGSLVRRWAGSAINAKLVIESKLRPGQYAYRRSGITGSGKSARAGAEIGCPQLLTDLRRP
jgi:hypothetical protein